MEEVSDLEKALCLLIKRAADIHDAKAAKEHQEHVDLAAKLDKMSSGPSEGLSSVASLDRDHSMGEEEHAVHAEASSSKTGDGSEISATTELVTPQIEKQLPRAARQVSLCFCDTSNTLFNFHIRWRVLPAWALV